MGAPCLDFETWDRLAQQGWVEAQGFSPVKRKPPSKSGSPNDAVFVGWGEKTAHLTAVDRGPQHARFSRAGVGDPSVKVKDRNGSLSPRVGYLSDPTGVLWHITDNRKA